MSKHFSGMEVGDDLSVSADYFIYKSYVNFGYKLEYRILLF